ncbi:MAG: diguanylate cyclase [Bryobacteraceae bacterium]
MNGTPDKAQKYGTLAQIYIGSLIAAGMLLLCTTLFPWETVDPFRFAGYLIATVLASGLKVALPGITGTMSVSYVFVLLGVLELNPSETMLISCTALLVQTYWRPKKRPTVIQALFNVSSIAIATAATCFVYQFRSMNLPGPAVLGVGACLYFFLNTGSIAAVVALTEHKSLPRVWRECYFWSFPYYLVGALIAALINQFNRHFGWPSSLLVLPVLYVIYRSYFLYLARLEREKRHAENEKRHAETVAALHLRTIEALALAIEAKDASAHNHLRRVQLYAVALGEELGLSGAELEALRAAAILHDIGNLAVPEHIVSKPGKLTPEEFEKMKVHPVVGAAILERVQFPYPVASTVRYHHERWDGSGYPEGLSGEQIPIGSRILAAVDCLNALASDRRYRRAVPIDEAMRIVSERAGTSFDPRVVDLLQRRYVELENTARAAALERAGSNDRKVTRDVPANGPGKSDAPAANQPEFLLSIAAAREEMQMLYELTNELGSSLSLHQTLAALDSRLKRMIPYETMVVYVERDGHLVPEFAQGDDSHVLSSLRIPVGEGLSGWVAQNLEPVINGDPALEPGYANDPAVPARLRAGLAVPLQGTNGVVGVLTLYCSKHDGFSRDHFRILLAISSKASMAIENALHHQQAEMSATTDSLTGLPNTRSLFLRLDAELSRCRRSNAPLAILVCDLDGFKQVNDRFGHMQGNKVLKTVAQGLAENCREYDYVARMGGDEFVMVLPGVRSDAIKKRARELNEMVRQAGLSICGEDLLSISVGDAHFPEHGLDAEQLLARADQCMYKVKKSHKAAEPRVRDLEQIQALAAAFIKSHAAGGR